MNRHLFIILYIFFSFLPLVLEGKTLEVRAGESIQSAIDWAVDGDVVLVYDGEYLENIDFKGKKITVSSKNGREVTTIQGLGDDSVVTFNLGENRSSVLEGFTITGGDGRLSGRSLYGGGIYCGDVSPTIRDCIISDNRAFTSGGGIYCYSSSPLISNCIIRENETSGDGGGMFCDRSSPYMIECDILENTAVWKGGGIYFWGGRANMLDCRISKNRASYGGGVYCNKLSAPNIIRCVISENSAETEGRRTGTFGGGIYSDSASPFISNCLITNNSAGTNGGGIYSSNFSVVTVINSTITRNTAQSFGGGIYYEETSLKIINTILWGDKVRDSPSEIYLFRWREENSSINITYSNVEGKVQGIGNLSSDPMFIDADSGNYNLQPDSPCVDAGNSSIMSLKFFASDIKGNSRPQHGLYDIGAYEFLPCDTPANRYYRDADEDGYGSVEDFIVVCDLEPPEGYILDKSDCGDFSSDIYPGAREICNGLDDNCDDRIDENFKLYIYYRDFDKDGYGNPNNSIALCAPESRLGYVLNGNDCDDSNPEIYPGAEEGCGDAFMGQRIPSTNEWGILLLIILLPVSFLFMKVGYKEAG